MKKLPFLFILFVIISCEQDGDSFSSGFESSSPSLSPQIINDQYNDNGENPFINTSEEPVSTFSIDADGASYSNVRRFIQQDRILPFANAIRTEELINYFDMRYIDEPNGHPISINGEVSTALWDSRNKLVRIGIKGKELVADDDKGTNYVFLIDVSGSMSSPDKLGLLKTGFKLFVDQLEERDKISIVTYAGSQQIVLNGIDGGRKQEIKEAIENLGSGGGTAGAQGIVTAYEIAQSNFIMKGNNRIILGTDGDFNIGVSSQEDLVALIKEKRDLGIFLTVLGVGRGNLNDAALEQIANKGNGTYEYIDKLEQLEKVFIHEKNKFFTAAKDVKIQVTFSPTLVEAYRLIGYENRALNNEDFEDDNEDAGEIGAGQSITALYEIIPRTNAQGSEATFEVSVRYKKPDSQTSELMETAIIDQSTSFSNSSDAMKLSGAIASFSMLLTNSQYKGNSSYQMVENTINTVNLPDPHGYIMELKNLVRTASGL